jgi:hypothetical protein
LDLDGIVAVDYTQQKTTIITDAHAAVLQNLKETAQKKMTSDKEYLLFITTLLYAGHVEESVT